MINGAAHMPTGDDVVRSGFDDWVGLLNHTGNDDMLKDPYNVWLEAFHVATLFERHGIMHAIQTQLQLVQPQDYDDRVMLSVEEVKQIQLRLLQQILQLIASKGLARRFDQQ